MTDYERGYEQGKADATKKMHPEIRKFFEDYFDKCFKEYQERVRPWVGIAQPEQEPVGHADLGINNIYIFSALEPRVVPAGRTPLYTAPRPWVGLTDEERKECIDWAIDLESTTYSKDLSKMIEHKLKEKNT